MMQILKIKQLWVKTVIYEWKSIESDQAKNGLDRRVKIN